MKKITLLLAVVFVFSAASLYAQTAQTRLDNGKRLFDQGNYDGAIQELTEAIRLDPNLAEAYAYRARAYAGDNNDQALSDANRAIQLDSRLAMGYFARGRAYEGKKEIDRAMTDYTEAIRLDPNFAAAYVNRGILYLYYKEDYDRAIADYEMALRIGGLSADNTAYAKSLLASAQAEKAKGPFEIANSALGGVKITRYNGSQTEVVIPATIDGARVTEIGDYSFALARGASPTENRTGVVTLKSVVLPSSLIAIGEGAFLYQPLTSISFPASLRTIGLGAFQGNKFTSVVIPNGVRFVDQSAFMSDTITSVTIPASLANYTRSELNPDRNEGFKGAFRGEKGPFVPRGLETNINRITLPANVDLRNFDLMSANMTGLDYFHGPDFALRDAYVGNGRKAGTFVWTGRIWRVE